MWIISSKIEASLIKDFKLDNTTSGSAFISWQKVFGLRPQTFSQLIKSSPSGIIHYCTGQGDVYPSMHGVGRCIPPCTRQGVSGYAGCLPGGCLPRGCMPRRGCLSRGLSAQGGVCPGRVSVQEACVSRHALRQGGVCPGGVCPGGRMSAQGTVCIPACTEVDTPLWTEFLIHDR